MLTLRRKRQSDSSRADSARFRIQPVSVLFNNLLIFPDSFDRFREIHRVVILFRIEFLIRCWDEKPRALQLAPVDSVSDHRQISFLEGGNAIDKDLDQSRQSDLVGITAGLGSQNVERMPIFSVVDS